jgi:signal peptidase I
MNNKWEKIIKNIISYVLVIGVAILIKIFIFSPIKINGTSMVPTLNDGEIMILNEIGYRLNGLERFDIAVANVDGERLIKRVIGLPGETVEYVDNKLYIDGKMMIENFKHGDTKDFSLSEINVDKIPDDYYFLVGDNRGNSKDSRIIGLIHKSAIMGKTNFILYPFYRIGKVQ